MQHTESKDDAGVPESAPAARLGPDWRGLAPREGSVCGGAKVGVLFSKSPRGGRREAGCRRWPKPLLNSLKNGSSLGVLLEGGDGLDDRRIAETLICFESQDRVSLGSCSGAILDRVVVVVPGVSVV